MATDRVQLSTWVTVEEAEEIRAAAADDNRTVSQWLCLAALEKARAAAEATA